MSAFKTALIVDDISTNRKLLNMLVSRQGIDVVEAVDGKDAVEQFAANEIDIVFMDIMMPVMDGFEATRQIRASAKGQQVKIVMVTALDGEDNVIKGMQAGADLYITKPYRANEIMSVLTED